MQVRVERELLVKAVNRTLGVVDRRGMMPILSHVLMEAEDGGITISATDLEISYRGFCPAEVQEPGALALPAHYFHNLVKGLPGVMVDLNGNGNGKLQVQADESHYRFVGLPPDQFPPVPEVAGESLVEVEAPTLKEMIDKTVFSTSGDDYQYALQSIYLERVEKEETPYLRMVSTDGHRLTIIDRPLSQDKDIIFAKGVLIPRKGALEISRTLDGEAAVGLSLTDKELALKANGKFLAVRLLDRKFPDYQRIIPEGFEYGFTLERKAFMEILRRISLLSSDRFKGVVLEIGPETLEATFANPDVGEGRESLPLALAWGEAEQLPLKVGFNAQYLLEPLNAMKSDKVILEINEPGRPCRLRGEGDPDYFGLVMPMELS
jgi:DNA polymerase-3 subunit beta